MSVEIVQEEEMDEEVLQWVVDASGYHAYTRAGLGLQIIRSASVQPPIENPAQYQTWLWMETVQGFFLARQSVIESVPQEWRLARRITPGEAHRFFVDFKDVVLDYIAGLHLSDG